MDLKRVSLKKLQHGLKKYQEIPSGTGAAHVDRTCHWREIASDPPAPGLRVQLIHKRDGVAYYGMWREGLDATHWAALPTFE